MQPDAARDEREAKGELASYAFWADHWPSVAELHRARSRHYYSDDGLRDHRLVGLCGAIHEYAVGGFAAGVAYEIRALRFHGGAREDVLGTLSVAFINGGHPAMYAAAAVARKELDAFVEPPADDRFPTGWVSTPDALESGMDYGQPAATAQDMANLRAWYVRTLGEIPRYVDFLAEHRPALLKAHRHRYEQALGDALPTQMLPYLLLRHHAVKGWADGIRENILLGLALGMTRAQLLDAICPAILHCGPTMLSVVDEVAGELLAPQRPIVA